jgi:hypothetical protein
MAPIYLLPWGRIDKWLAQWTDNRRSALAGALDLDHCRDLPILNVSVDGDEAGDYLRFHQTVSRAMYGGIRALARLTHALSILVPLMLMIFGQLILTFAPERAGMLLAILLFAICGVPVIMVLLPWIIAVPMMVSRSGPLGFGEAILDPALIDVAVTLRPPSKNGKWVRIRPGGDISNSRFHFLMHSRILWAEVTAQRVGDWLGRELRVSTPQRDPC